MKKDTLMSRPACDMVLNLMQHTIPANGTSATTAPCRWHPKYELNSIATQTQGQRSIYRKTMQTVSEIITPSNTNDLNNINTTAANGFLGLLHQYTVTTEHQHLLHRTQQLEIIQQKKLLEESGIEYFLCISPAGVALRNSSNTNDRGGTGPNVNDIVQARRVVGKEHEWIQIISDNSERNNKFLPILLKHEVMFRKW